MKLSKKGWESKKWSSWFVSDPQAQKSKLGTQKSVFILFLFPNILTIFDDDFQSWDATKEGAMKPLKTNHFLYYFGQKFHKWHHLFFDIFDPSPTLVTHFTKYAYGVASPIWQFLLSLSGWRHLLMAPNSNVNIKQTYPLY